MTDPVAPITPSPLPPSPLGPGSGSSVAPLVIGRDDARRAAADELAKPVYAHARPGLAQRVLDWIGHQLNQFFDKAFGTGSGSGSGSGWWGLAILLALLAGVVVLIRWKYGPMRRAVQAENLLFDETTALDAAGYRKAAVGFAASGDWSEAVRARLRAIITSLEERTILEPRPGRTADVAAREAGAALPSQAEALLTAARIFDDIWYGEGEAAAEDYQRLAMIDDAVAAARPRHTVAAGTGVENG